jgi:hypothetical protein
MRRAPRDPKPAKRWLAFLHNHREAIAAMDFFTVVVHQNHPRTEKAVVPSAWSANFRRDLLIDPGKIELIS